MTPTKATTAKAKGKTEATEEVAGTEAEGSETKVGPLHEAHAAYIKRTTGFDVDPQAIFLVYSTRVAFRKTSDEYKEVGAKKAAIKEAAEQAKAEAKAKKEAERKEAAEKKAAEKAEKAKAAAEAKAKAQAEKEAKAAEKAKAEAAKAPKVTKASTDTATTKPKKGKAAF
jgi:colicin import membrane protein